MLALAGGLIERGHRIDLVLVPDADSLRGRGPGRRAPLRPVEPPAGPAHGGQRRQGVASTDSDLLGLDPARLGPPGRRAELGPTLPARQAPGAPGPGRGLLCRTGEPRLRAAEPSPPQDRNAPRVQPVGRCSSGGAHGTQHHSIQRPAEAASRAPVPKRRALHLRIERRVRESGLVHRNPSGQDRDHLQPRGHPASPRGVEPAPGPSLAAGRRRAGPCSLPDG